MRNLTPAELEAKFPKLRPGNYKKTSDASARYNCIAFANDTDRKWWEAGRYGGRYYWPEKISDTLEGWVELFIRQGYTVISNGDVEAGVEKVAIYVDCADLQPSHVAKSDGRTWKSKLGRYQDIEHSTLDLLEGERLWEYGMVERILSRPARRSPKSRGGHKKRRSKVKR